MTLQKYKASISHFTVEVPYTVTTFEALRELGRYLTMGKGIYAWTFPMADYEHVKALLNADIEMNEAEIIKASQNCPSLKETVFGEVEAKGKGKMVVRFQSPEIIEVSYIEAGERVTKEVPKAVLKRFYDVAIADLEIGAEHGSREIAEKVIRDYPLDRFKRESGSPDANKFYGTRNTTGYFGFFYLPLKVLQALNVVKHTRGKKVIRIGSWDGLTIDNTRFVDKEVWLWGDRLPVDIESDADG